MKTNRNFKFVLGLSLVAIVSTFTLSSFTPKTSKPIVKLIVNNSINIIIDSNTSPEDLADIKKMLKENDITVKFSNIKRNADNKLIAIKIELKDINGNTAVSQISSTNPINQLSFGKKNGSLYISQEKDGFGNIAFSGDDVTMGFHFDKDSLFNHHFKLLDSLKHGNMFMFNSDDDAYFFNGKHFDLDSIKNSMENLFFFEKDDNGNHFFYNNDESDTHSKHQKFRFIDSPEIVKIIVIDGKESNFETLNDLAKNDKLETVDVLKPNTAMSIYGKKAKDGAIIATTK